MLIVGDVLATIAILLAFAGAAYGGMVLSGLLFKTHSATTAKQLEAHPVISGFFGLFVLLPAIVFIGVLFSLKLPIATFVGLITLGFVLLAATIGSGGIARLVSQRILKEDPAVNSFAALSKAAGLLTLACIMPFFGWFFVAPLFLILSIGAGTMALFQGKKSSVASEAQ